MQQQNRRSRHDTGKFEISTLRNGIEVFRQAVPVGISDEGILVIGLRNVGGRQDFPGQEGIGHHYEHSPFRGSLAFPRYAEAAGHIDSLGGFLNAMTGWAWTYYYVTAPRETLEQCALTLSDVVFRPLFRAEDVQVECGVIKAEIREQSKDGWLPLKEYIRVHETPSDSRFALPLIGTPASLDAITRESVVDFHHRFMVPANMVIFAGGAFAEDVRLYEILSRYFGDVEPRGERASLPEVNLAFMQQGTVKQITKEVSFPEDVYVCHYVIPRTIWDYRFNAALELLFQTVNGGISYPLQQRLRGTLGKAYKTGALGGFGQPDFTIFSFSVVIPASYFDFAEHSFQTVLEEVTKESFEKTRLIRQLRRAREYTKPLPATFGAWHNLNLFGSLISDWDQQQLVDEATFDDVIRVRDYFLNAQPWIFRCVKIKS